MINKPQTFIFFGRSGCGKGTQLKLLREYLEKEDSGRKQFAFSTGDGFREFFSKETYASNIAKDITARGLLQPLFLTVSLWGNAFLNNLEQNDHLFIDGYPRRKEEAEIVDGALKFFNRDNIIIIDFIVSRETSKKRMLLRGRYDDTEENTETRLNWYDKDVTPAIEYLKNQPGYVYMEIDGEGSIESIQEEIINKIKPYLI
jgi:adenylate kinase family enzyme